MLKIAICDDSLDAIEQIEGYIDNFSESQL